ncbi:MAG: tetratricopeptide repeat protein [Deltaproteobacteria bacterium]|nr:tetratricopeptide repeat protein [Deltaproteobacteria bacterium]MBI3293727.1 tetratricopeptide repeat protein [Deltaproteobacteria bacterium]
MTGQDGCSRKNNWLAALLALTIILVGCTARKQTKFFDLAEEKIQGGSYFEAADAFRRGIALNPESRLALKALFRLGFVQEVYLRDYESALGSYQEYLRLRREPIGQYEVQKRVANIYFDYVQDPERSVTAYRKLLDLQADSLEKDQFIYRIGRSYFLQNNFELARSQYQALIDSVPKSQLVPKARFEIGNTYFMEAKYRLAIDAFKQVVRYHPQHPQAIEAQFWIAQSLEQLGEGLAARTQYEQLRLKYPIPELIEKRLQDIDKRGKKK